MSPRIVVVPASTKAGRETIRQLLGSEKKPLVRGIYRDTSKAPLEFTEHPCFEAAEGNVATATGLDFNNSDAVFYIPPPTYDGTDQSEWATRCANHIRDAVQASSSVKKLLVLSALGAQHNEGIGILRLNHITDTILGEAAKQVMIARPGYFQEDFMSAIEAAQEDRPVVHSWSTPLDHKVPMVSLKDIARACTDALLAESTKESPYCFKLFGPRHYSSLDLKMAAEQATGKTVELKLVEREHLAAFFGQHIPKAHLGEFVEFVEAVLPGGTIEGDFKDEDNTVRGETELADTLCEMFTKWNTGTH